MSADHRARIEAHAATFTAGEVVLDEEHPGVLGIVTEAHARSLTIVWEHGGRSAGPGQVLNIRHREPRVNVEVPVGALGNLGWNREQAVKAALRKAGLR